MTNLFQQFQLTKFLDETNKLKGKNQYRDTNVSICDFPKSIITFSAPARSLKGQGPWEGKDTFVCLMFVFLFCVCLCFLLIHNVNYSC